MPAVGPSGATQRPRRSTKGRSAAAQEEPEHGAAKGLAAGGPAHEGAVGPEAAVGDDAGRQPRRVAEEGTAVEAVGASRLARQLGQK